MITTVFFIGIADQKLKLGMKKRKTTFSKEFKEDVLELYKKAGPKAASEAFGVEKSLLLTWRRKLGVEKFSSISSTPEETVPNPGALWVN